MSVVADQELKEYKVIGSRPIRHDGVDKVTGRALYGADIHLPGLLYGKVLRSPHAHARIRRIDVSKALALPGVKAVATGADLPSLSDTVKALGEGSVNLKYQSTGLLADDKVLYHGHPVAAVAATSIHIAEEALALIEVDYELLPPVLDVRAAMQEGAPILLDDLRTNELGEQMLGPDQRRRAHPASARRSGARFRRGRRDRRARVHHQHGAPGLHRAADRAPRSGTATA